MTSSSDEISQMRANKKRPTLRLGWRHFAFAVGPGLVAMLADTDAGSVTTVAQSGAQWGYRLLLPNLLLIPVMFMAQELALRLGLGTRRGLGELVRERFGRMPALVLLGIVAVSCSGALVSQLSGLAGAGEALGVPVWATMTAAVGGLLVVLYTGIYGAIQRIALLVGLFELAFLIMAWRAAPGLGPIARQAAELPLHDRNYLYLLAANFGTSIIPWTLLYQQSASIAKGLGTSHLRGARIETLVGVLLCQTITSALLIAAAALLGKNHHSLDSIADIETAFTATLGNLSGHLTFVVGLSGSALVATIVVWLAFSWTVGDVLGVRHSLSRGARAAPWLYAALGLMLVASGALVACGVDLVRLSIAASVVNALLLPLVLGFLYQLARTQLPEPLRLKGVYAAVTGLVFVVAAAVGLGSGIVGLV